MFHITLRCPSLLTSPASPEINFAFIMFSKSELDVLNSNDHDQLRGYYAIGTKSRKWWRYLFWFCVDVSIVNAFILERKAINHCSRTQLDFRVELAKDLIGEFSSRGRTASAGQLEVGHWSIPFSKGRCKRCLKRKKTTFARMGYQLCNKRVCLDCFPNHVDDLA